jgi:hypothetical protein
MTYHPVVGLGEAPGERVDAVGDVGERAGGGRGGEDRCSNREQLVSEHGRSMVGSGASLGEQGVAISISPARWRSLGGRSTWVVALTTATSRSLRSRPPPFTLASPTVAESLMAPHALRQLLCTDAVPIGAAPGAGRLALLSVVRSRHKSSPSPRVVARAWQDSPSKKC